MIFFLPFVLPRVFRPTFLAVFEIDNFELGTYYSVYGLVAIGAYFLGGPIADRFPAHKLMSVALISTGLGGLFLMTFPDMKGMFWLYGFWGLTTILLFWAALMRATRIIGGLRNQGLAFGLLDGGRGLVAAIVGLLAVGVLSEFLPDNVLEADLIQRSHAFKMVVLFFTSFVFATSLLVYFVLKSVETSAIEKIDRISLKYIKDVIKLPTVWLQALIIICAYSGYRVADDFSLMAQDVLRYDEVQAASVGTLSLWLRPLAAILAGVLADRFTSSKITMYSFLLLICSGLIMGFGPVEKFASLIVMITIITTGLGVFALRGLYFAIMQEGRIPVYVTGTAVGLASVIGYLPDIYMAPLMGFFLDTNPGVQGHQYVFLLLTGFSCIGFFGAWRFRLIAQRN